MGPGRSREATHFSGGLYGICLFIAVGVGCKFTVRFIVLPEKAARAVGPRRYKKRTLMVSAQNWVLVHADGWLQGALPDENVRYRNCQGTVEHFSAGVPPEITLPAFALTGPSDYVSLLPCILPAEMLCTLFYKSSREVPSGVSLPPPRDRHKACLLPGCGDRVFMRSSGMYVGEGGDLPSFSAGRSRKIRYFDPSKGKL